MNPISSRAPFTGSASAALAGLDSPLSLECAARESTEDTGWLITLSDLTLLLICFLALGYVKDRERGSPPPHLRPVAPRTAAQTPGASAEDQRSAGLEWRALQDEMRTWVGALELSRDVTIETAHDGIVLSLKDTIPFASGKAALRPRALPVIHKVAEIALGRPDLSLEVNGHTDDRPISTSEFPSNWELSAARASRVARYLVERGVHPSRIAVQGYAFHRPRATNGKLGSRGANRRVEIRLFREIKKIPAR